MTPPWKEESKLIQKKINSVISDSNPNINSSSSSSSRHTIWDIPERKYEPTPPASMTSSWDNKPNYFPSRSSTHFSFLPKAETRPGSIIPSYGGEGRRSCLDKADRKSPLKSNKVLASSSVNDIRKSCLKTQSSDSLKSRSQSPSVVKFSPKNPSNGT